MNLKYTTIFNFNDFTNGISGDNRHIYDVWKKKIFLNNEILLEKELDIISDLTVNEIDKFKFDFILIPESSNSFMVDLCIKYNFNYIILKKNTLDNIANGLNEIDNIQKSQKISIINHIQKIKENNQTLKMQDFKGSQRQILSYLLFDIKLDSSKNYLIFDDSVFSGHTLKSIQNTLTKQQCSFNTLIMFSF